MMREKTGQMSGEYLLLIGVLIIAAILSIAFIAEEQELNTAMSSARNGVTQALSVSSIYPTDTYDDYLADKENLLDLYSVDIVNVSYRMEGYDDVYDRQKIQFKVYAISLKDFDKEELDSIGDRINFNLRKSIAVSFNTTNAGNKLYNPVFSPNYVYTTADVVWI